MDSDLTDSKSSHVSTNLSQSNLPHPNVNLSACESSPLAQSEIDHDPHVMDVKRDAPSRPTDEEAYYSDSNDKDSKYYPEGHREIAEGVIENVAAAELMRSQGSSPEQGSRSTARSMDGSVDNIDEDDERPKQQAPQAIESTDVDYSNQTISSEEEFDTISEYPDTYPTPRQLLGIVDSPFSKFRPGDSDYDLKELRIREAMLREGGGND